MTSEAARPTGIRVVCRKAVREFSEPDAEEKTGHERAATATNSNVSHIPLVQVYTYTLITESPSDHGCGMRIVGSLGTSLAYWPINALRTE